jgi:hypothetical protein
MLERSVEIILQDAIRKGEFENLPGSGKPVTLDAYFATPPELRVAYSVLHNAGLVCREVELLREVAELKGCASRVPLPEERAFLL